MRIRDIFEDKSGIDEKNASTLPSTVKYPQMDNAYELYRFGVSMAGQPGPPGPTSTIGDVPVLVPYSKGDEDIIRATEKIHGVKGRSMNSKGSSEPAGTNKVSPTAKPKRNRYGV